MEHPRSAFSLTFCINCQENKTRMKNNAMHGFTNETIYIQTLVKLLTHPILLLLDISSLLVIWLSTSRILSAGSIEDICGFSPVNIIETFYIFHYHNNNKIESSLKQYPYSVVFYIVKYNFGVIWYCNIYNTM